jgi:hypothetical protein
VDYSEYTTPADGDPSPCPPAHGYLPDDDAPERYLDEQWCATNSCGECYLPVDWCACRTQGD